MPLALSDRPEPPQPLIPRRKRWTRAECAPLVSSGQWDQERLELIDGELISKMGQNPPHVFFLARILWLVHDIFGRERVHQNAPIDVSPEDNPTNEPEPDIIVLTQPSLKPRAENPQPADLALVIEVSDTSFRFDRAVKARLYARAGIIEYWILDIPGRRLIVHREPAAGDYRSVVAYSEFEKVSPLASPDHELNIAQIFAGC